MQRIKNIFLSFIFNGSFCCFGQNLVPNPSFEDTLACPTTIGLPNNDQVINAPPWQRTTIGTPDYFNNCNSGIVGVPSNFQGYQQARTGIAYTGIFTRLSSTPNYREYISSGLQDTLQSGLTYYVEIFINLSCPNPSCPAGNDGIGIYLSNGMPDTPGIGFHVLPYTPQIINSLGNIISDTVNWTRISGTFVASGGENYVTIGNFRDDANTTGSDGYYYIDDVLVIADSLTGNVDVNESDVGNLFDITPNPCTGIFIIHTNQPLINSTIIISNIIGEKIYEQRIESEKTEIDLNEQPAGIYFLSLTKDSGNKAVKKIIKL